MARTRPRGRATEVACVRACARGPAPPRRRRARSPPRPALILDDYYLFYATRADFLRRLGEDASDVYARALKLAPCEVEREFLRSRALER